jgi:hypothetical protein
MRETDRMCNGSVNSLFPGAQCAVLGMYECTSVWARFAPLTDGIDAYGARATGGGKGRQGTASDR